MTASVPSDALATAYANAQLTTITIQDNTAVGVAFETTAVTLAEGGSAHLRARLCSTPLANVTVNLLGFGLVATAAPQALTFSAQDWNVYKDVSVVAGRDYVVRGAALPGSLGYTLASTDSNWDGASYPLAVEAQVTNVDVAGVTLSSFFVTAVEGSRGTLTARLASIPAAPVTVTLAFTDASGRLAFRGNVSDAEPLGPALGASLALSFTAANWNQPQQIALAAAYDPAANPDLSIQVQVTCSSDDTTYSSLAYQVQAAVPNNNAQINVASAAGANSGWAMTEGGGLDLALSLARSSISYTVNVDFVIQDATNRLALSTDGSTNFTKTFAPSTAGQTQFFRIAASDNNVYDGAGARLCWSIRSVDPYYQGIPQAAAQCVDIAVSDDLHDLFVFTPGSGSLTLSQPQADGYVGGSVALSLARQPTSTVGVQIALTPPAGIDATFADDGLTSKQLFFSDATWAVPQSVPVKALGRGAVPLSIAASSGDASYSGSVSQAMLILVNAQA